MEFKGKRKGSRGSNPQRAKCLLKEFFAREREARLLQTKYQIKIRKTLHSIGKKKDYALIGVFTGTGYL